MQNTSEWEGTLFGKSDVIDRNRNLSVEGKGRKGDPRPLAAPGRTGNTTTSGSTA